MIQNYLRIALRHLQKHKGYAFINIFGLTVGLACCLLIVLFVRSELSYDRFHENAAQTYRIVRQNLNEDERASSVTASVPLAPELARTYPEITRATRLLRYWFTPLVSRGDRGFYEEDLFFTDAAFFDVFSFRFRSGSRETALDAPFSILLTETAARKYFGDDDPLGQTLTLNAELTYTVTGVLEDPPHASHLHFDLLASIESIPEVMGWATVLEDQGLQAFPTYVTLREGADPKQMETKLVDFALSWLGEETPVRYLLQPLTDIHLYSRYRGEIEANSDIRYVWILSGIALIILLLACINYTNLATARFARRTREVGIRKTVGASRRQLTLQFLTESLLLAALAMLAALALLQLLLPAFSALVGTPLAFDEVMTVEMLAILFGIALFAGLAAGSYPAFYLSAFRPGLVLQGAAGGPRRAPLRKVLVVFQYAIAVILIAGAGIIHRQLGYIQAKKLGFEREQVVVLPVRDEQIQQRPEVAKAAFLALPEVTHAANSTSLPGTATPSTTDLRPEGIADGEPLRTFLAWIDEDYVDALGMEIVAGRNISPDRGSDPARALLLNETAVREIGWGSPAEAVGKRAELWGEQREIVGVVQDFHFEALREPIKPMVIFPNFDDTRGLILRLRTDDLPATLERLASTWQQLTTAQPFTYTFLDQDLGRLYVAERRWGQVIGAAALFALLIACLGLFGLASFLAEQRTKEIGLRKVLGASASGIALLVTRDFARLVTLAFVVGAPVAYLAAHRWLEGFAYRVETPWWLFLLAGLATLLIALLTVSFQAIRAAMANPVDSLRYE